MGVVFAIILLIVIAYILGAGIELIAAALLGLAALATVFIGLFFTVCTVILLFTKRVKGEFSRIGESPKNGFSCAFYSVDGTEYPCIFPCEMMMRDRLYKQGGCTLFLWKRFSRVFDGYSVLTVAVGMIFTVGVTMAVIIFWV